jgi:pyridoxamine 5'-phosphate oxidase
MPPLLESSLDPNPLAQLARWYADAQAASVPFADAMTLATATPDGSPSARMVLYKGTESGGILFYTNYESRKARELDENPRAALVFHWPALERQIRLEGTTERLSRPESEAYHRSRPRESQLGAWASHQSAVILSRAELENAYAEISKRFEGKEVPCPENWGGYRLTPVSIEFWASGGARLHDRLRYTREGAAGWRVERLSP